MNNIELKEALFNQRPVVLKMPYSKDVEYTNVSALIYRVVNGKTKISAELYDKNKNSVTVAPSKYIRYKE